MEKIVTRQLDSNESAFLSRQLAYVKTKTYDRIYPEYTATRMFPVSAEAGAGAESIIIQSFNAVGMAKIISDYSDDLPRVDAVAEEHSIIVRSIADSYAYNVQEVKAKAMAQRNGAVNAARLTTRKAEAAKRGVEAKINNIAWKAQPSKDAGLVGFFYNPNVTKAVAPNGASGNSTWATKTPTEILADLNGIVNSIFDITNGVERPDTLGLPNAQYALISSTPRSSTSDTTILDFFVKNNPFIKTVEPIFEAKGLTPTPMGGTTAKDVMFAYTKSADKLTLELPLAFEQLPVEPRGMEFIVGCHARTGGMAIYYPLSVAIWEGI